MAKREIQLRAAIREAMTEEMKNDEEIFLMGEEVAEYNGAYKVSEGMLDEFGEKRVIDTPISELGFAGLGTGAAMHQMRPIIEFMTFNFAVLALDQIINCAAKIYSMSGGQFNIPIVFRGPSGSAGQLAATHSQSFENWLANMPGLKVISCVNPYDCKGLLKSAIRDDDPVMFMESEVMYGKKGEVPEKEYTLPIGEARVRKEGEDITLVTFNKMIKPTLEGAEALENEYDVSTEVIDLRTIRPLDYETVLKSVMKTNRIVTVEESHPFGGIGSEIGYAVQRHAFDYLDAPVKRVTGADTPLHYAPNLVDKFLPDKSDVVDASKQVLYLN